MFNFFKRLFLPKTPNAALVWQEAGNPTANESGNAFWIFALPVHLILQRDTFSLAEPTPLMLEKSESDALSLMLNTHFESQGYGFFWHQNCWLLSLALDPQIETKAPQLAINKDVRAFLPTGQGAKNWASFVNEVQMLLFEHPVNIAREINNQPAVNSIWCYGLGQAK